MEQSKALQAPHRYCEHPSNCFMVSVLSGTAHTAAVRELIHDDDGPGITLTHVPLAPLREAASTQDILSEEPAQMWVTFFSFDAFVFGCVNSSAMWKPFIKKTFSSRVVESQAGFRTAKLSPTCKRKEIFKSGTALHSVPFPDLEKQDH